MVLLPQNVNAQEWRSSSRAVWLATFPNRCPSRTYMYSVSPEKCENDLAGAYLVILCIPAPAVSGGLQVLEDLILLHVPSDFHVTWTAAQHTLFNGRTT